MARNQVIIIEHPTFVYLKDSCLNFEQKGELKARILPEDIDCLILHYTTTITASAVKALATKMATVTILNDDQTPFAHWQPYQAINKRKRRIKNQIALEGSVLAQKLWQKIVSAKVFSQAQTLKLIKAREAKHLAELAKKVKMHDLDNIEAQAARVYWKALFGKKFKRIKRHSKDPINQHLNFGYSILRSLISKWLSAKGIALEWGVGHNNQDNIMCLVDDIIEPFRFIVDRAIVLNYEKFDKEISAKSKRYLLSEIYQPVSFNNKVMRLNTSIEECCASHAQILDRPSKAASSWLKIPSEK